MVCSVYRLTLQEPLFCFLKENYSVNIQESLAFQEQMKCLYLTNEGLTKCSHCKAAKRNSGVEKVKMLYEIKVNPKTEVTFFIHSYKLTSLCNIH